MSDLSGGGDFHSESRLIRSDYVNSPRGTISRPANAAPKEKLMKRHSSVFGAIALLLLGICPVFAHAGCTASTIIGTYGFSEEGYGIETGKPNPKFLPIALVGTFTFNADGTVNRALTISGAGGPASGADSGTYTVNADCSGTALFPNSP